MGAKTWTTKDGTKIRIRDMTDAHLVNTIRFLIRAARQRQDDALASPPMFQGEMAQYYADQEWESIACTPVEVYASQCYPVFDSLMDEAHRRGLEEIF